MHLEKISIKNFRIFEELELTLNPGLNLLVGENDSGKTSLIDAVRLVLGTNSTERGFFDESDFHNDATELAIQLKFVDVTKHAHVFVEHLTYEEDPSDDSKLVPVLYIQLTAKNTGKERRGYPLISTDLKTGVDGNGLRLDSDIRSFLSTTYLKPLRDAEAELSAGRGSRLSQILASSKELSKTESIDSILKLIADTNAELVKQDEPIHKTSQRIESDYLHKLVFEEDKSFLKAIIDISGIKNVAGTDIQKRKHLRAILESLKLTLGNDQRKHGLGYNNILFMAAELLLLEQELDAEFPLLLIEEPEAHLHPQLQLKLLDFIVSKTKGPENKDGLQCIISTHSPNISSKADPSDIIMMSKGSALSLRPSETELSSENYHFLKTFLDVTKANLFFARGVILVEGDSENILIPKIAKLLGRPLEDYGISIVNLGNTAWKHFANIFLRKESETAGKNPVKVAVIRDLDMWPATAELIDDNPFGFKTKKDGNAWRWLSTDPEIKRQAIIERTSELKKDANNQSLEKQNVKVCISNLWTFEYCLAYFGLFNECYEALNGNLDNIDSIVGTNEEKATYIQKEVSNSKTDFASKFAIILDRNYGNDIDGLKENLPEYIVAAIEHVTAPTANEG